VVAQPKTYSKQISGNPSRHCVEATQVAPETDKHRKECMSESVAPIYGGSGAHRRSKSARMEARCANRISFALASEVAVIEYAHGVAALWIARINSAKDLSQACGTSQIRTKRSVAHKLCWVVQVLIVTTCLTRLIARLQPKEIILHAWYVDRGELLLSTIEQLNEAGMLTRPSLPGWLTCFLLAPKAKLNSA